MLPTFISIIASLLLLPSLFGPFPFASAAVSNDLSGFAWSPNSGWLSFNCTDASPSCSGTDYGVDVTGSAPTKTLSGYAWSSSLGWITFNSADMAMTLLPESATCNTAGYPPCSPTAIFTTSDGKVSGWARACTVFASGCNGLLKSNDERGGWDGWISLRSTSNYGVLANGSKWTGYAWGGGSVTGTVAPPVGGNAVPGWISFRGLTTEVIPTVYGVNASGNAIGPQVISCGADKQLALLNEVVTWTVKYDSSIVSPTFEWVSLSSESFVAPVNGSTETKAYTISGTKSALVKVTTSSGEVYVVDCDGTVVPGQTDPGYPSVVVAPFNLVGDSVTVPSGAQEGVQINVTGQFDYTGPALSTPFTIQFEFDTNGDGVAEQSSNTYTVSNLSANQQNIIVSAPWTPGTPDTDYRIRLCVDTPVPGVIPETVDTTADNCTAWSANFIVSSAVSPLNGSAAVCKAIPGLTQANKSVVWTITGITGGTEPYTYDWTFPGGTPTSGSGSPSTPVSYSTTGTKTATVTVHSQSPGELVVPCSGNVRVQIFEEF